VTFFLPHKSADGCSHFRDQTLASSEWTLNASSRIEIATPARALLANLAAFQGFARRRSGGAQPAETLDYLAFREEQPTFGRVDGYGELRENAIAKQAGFTTKHLAGVDTHGNGGE
jgi:hypothetical protein